MEKPLAPLTSLQAMAKRKVNADAENGTKVVVSIAYSLN
jgi:hypothetical protein